MKYACLLVIFLAVSLFAGCDSNDTLGDERYTYVAFTDSGELVIKGTLNLNIFESGDSKEISGTWVLRQVADADNIGPQIGEGDLIGSVTPDGLVAINLNPQISDNNVLLTGRFEDERLRSLTGSWVYSTLLGNINGGSFEADR